MGPEASDRAVNGRAIIDVARDAPHQREKGLSVRREHVVQTAYLVAGQQAIAGRRVRLFFGQRVDVEPEGCAEFGNGRRVFR